MYKLFDKEENMTRKQSKFYNEIETLKTYKKNIESKLIKFPEGRLGIRNSGGKPRFFQIIGNKKSGLTEKYLSEKYFPLAKTLAQKEYYFKVLKYIEQRLKNIEKINKLSDNEDLIDIYNNLSPVRKSLVTPIEPTWEEQVDAWYKKNYEKPDSKYDNLKLATKNGEFVRSKTERFMADFFFDNGIKYKYEKIIYLEGYGPASSDFTFLSPYTKEEIYWEHFGMVDNPEYALNMVKKINAYQINSYVIGKNLIVTFESSKEVLNLNIVKSLVNEHLINNDKIK